MISLMRAVLISLCSHFLRKMSCLTDNGNFMKNNSINIIGVRKKGISLHCYKANAMLCYLCCCLIFFFYRFSSKDNLHLKIFTLHYTATLWQSCKVKMCPSSYKIAVWNNRTLL